MKCEECRNLLLEILETDAGTSTDPAADRHLQQCESCRSWWREVQLAAGCLEKAQPARMAAPPFEAVWRRIHARPRRTWKLPWDLRSLLDSLEVIGAAAVVAALVYGLQLVTAEAASHLPGLPSSVLSALQDPISFAGIAALLGMLAGACSAPLFLKKQNGYARR